MLSYHARSYAENFSEPRDSRFVVSEKTRRSVFGADHSLLAFWDIRTSTSEVVTSLMVTDTLDLANGEVPRDTDLSFSTTYP